MGELFRLTREETEFFAAAENMKHGTRLFDIDANLGHKSMSKMVTSLIQKGLITSQTKGEISIFDFVSLTEEGHEVWDAFHG